MAKGLAVITGASSGIGAATAKALSEGAFNYCAKLNCEHLSQVDCVNIADSAGHPLLLLARRVEKCEALNLPNTISRKVDVTDRATFSAAVEEAEKKFG